MSRLGELYFETEDFTKCVEVLKRADTLYKKTGATKSTTYAKMMHQLSKVYRTNGNMTECVVALKQAMKAADKTLDMDIRIRSAIYGDLSSALEATGDISEAYDFMHKAWGGMRSFLESKDAADLGLAAKELKRLNKKVPKSPQIKSSLDSYTPSETPLVFRGKAQPQRSGSLGVRERGFLFG